MITTTATSQDFGIGDRVPYIDHRQGGVVREARVREVSPRGTLRLQEVGGPRLPWWISQSTAAAWTAAEARLTQQ